MNVKSTPFPILDIIQFHPSRIISYYNFREFWLILSVFFLFVNEVFMTYFNYKSGKCKTYKIFFSGLKHRNKYCILTTALKLKIKLSI